MTKDEKKPFRVVVKKQTVEVLGTEFNVDAYPGERNTYTTLVSGKVKVDADGQTVILNPGMQSVVNDEKCTPEGKRGGGNKLAKRDVRVRESYLGGDHVETGSLV